MDFIMRVTVGPNPRAERHHGRIVEVDQTHADGREALFHLEDDTTRNNLVDPSEVSQVILDLVRVWGEMSDRLWTITDMEEAP